MINFDFKYFLEEKGEFFRFKYALIRKDVECNKEKIILSSVTLAAG